MNDPVRFAVVGNGKMASDVLRLVARAPGAEVVAGIGDPRHEAAQSRLAECCAELKVPYLSCSNINDSKAVDAVKRLRPTYLVSANNFHIFRSASLDAAEKGIINFHNGPLPRYGGLNACSWALFNGELEHGVTWHLIDSDIDTGPILAQRRFPIDPEERAISLISRCIREGVDLLAGLLPALIEGRTTPVPQLPQQRLYYGARARPFEGHLPWWESAEVLNRLARGLSFHPLPNSFFRPSFHVQGHAALHAGEISVGVGQAGSPGLVGFSDGCLTVQCADSIVIVEDLYDAAGHEITLAQASAEFGIAEGILLSRPS